MIARILVFAAMIGVCAIAIAQSPPVGPTPGTPGQGGQERKPRDVFFHAMYETRSRGGQEMGYLLFQKKVRDELGLTDEHSKALIEVGKKLRSETDQLHALFDSKKVASDELVPKLRELVTQSDQKFLEAIGSDAARQRLIELFVQHRKALSALNELVAARIGLVDEKRKEILVRKEKRERELMDEAFNGAHKFEDRRKNWEKIQRQMVDLVAQELTPEQLSKLEALKGKPFEFEPPPMGPGRPRRERDEHRDRNCCEVASIE